MIERKVVKRYAAALFAEAERAGVIDVVEIDLGLANYSLESNPELYQAMVSPLVPKSKKHEIARQVFDSKIHEITLNYLHLLIDKRREEVIKYTEEEYIHLANEARGVITAKVTSSVELTVQEMSELKTALSNITGKKVELDLDLDSSILGGVIVRIGDRVWDGSVTGYLDALREQLLNGQTPHETE